MSLKLLFVGLTLLTSVKADLCRQLLRFKLLMWCVWFVLTLIGLVLVQEAASAGAKLLCFPESFSFIGANDGDSVKIAEPLDGPIMQQYRSLAR